MKKNSKPPMKNASPKSGGAFSFKDRSGKVHGNPSGKPKTEEESEPRKFREDRPRTDRPTPRPSSDRKFGDKKFEDRGPRPFGEKKFGEKKFGDKKFGDKKFGAKRFDDSSRGGDRGPPRADRPVRPDQIDRGYSKDRTDRGTPRRGEGGDRGERPAFRSDRGPPRGGDRGERPAFRSDRGPPRGGDRGERPAFRSDRGPPRGGDRGERPAFHTDIPDNPNPQFSIVSKKDSKPIHLKATLEKNPKGFAFLIFDKREFEDAFLSPDQAAHYFHGDRLEVVTNGRGDVLSVSVLQHRYSEIVGKYFRQGKRDVLLYERKRIREEILLRGLKDKVESGDWVRAKLVFEEDENAYPPFYAEAIEVFGPNIPASADLAMIAAEFGCIEEHSAESIKEAENHKLDLNDPDRMDLCTIPFITIDGETARDFDDAIFVEKLPSAGYRLWVAIADVSHYVTKDSALDVEAFQRATSTYFPERAFHMLPRALSENLCSLRPNEKRLTMVCRMDFTFEGRMTSKRVMNALIESRRRATYEEIQKEWEASKGASDFPYLAHFELFKVLKKKRHGRGSIDFDLPEAEIRVDKTGEPTSITQRTRMDAHRLIEEFMIASNEAVSEWAMERNSPFIFRVHEEPAEKTLQKFQELCHNSGIEVEIDFDDLTGSIQRLLKLIDGHPAQTLLNSSLLRSMKQAHYTSVHGRHFGLASAAYSHFTSPIRRYPDLLAHRMLKRILIEEKSEKKLSTTEREELEQILQDAAEHCSYRERVAAEAERESLKLKQARFMLKEVGNTFLGKITGMMERGFFITLEAPFVEGMVAVESIGDDFYEFREDRMLFQGKRKKKTFTIGQKIEVLVARVDLETRQIDFNVLPDQAGDPSKARQLKTEPSPEKLKSHGSYKKK